MVIGLAPHVRRIALRAHNTTIIPLFVYLFSPRNAERCPATGWSRLVSELFRFHNVGPIKFWIALGATSTGMGGRFHRRCYDSRQLSRPEMANATMPLKLYGCACKRRRLSNFRRFITQV